jgi:hypothetical protein
MVDVQDHRDLATDGGSLDPAASPGVMNIAVVWILAIA